MRHLSVALSVACLSGCYSMIVPVSAFNPYIEQDGAQKFRFVAGNDLARTNRDILISNELGSRKYCMNGYDLVNTYQDSSRTIYEGVCRPEPAAK